jgi:transposase-like protein
MKRIEIGLSRDAPSTDLDDEIVVRAALERFANELSAHRYLEGIIWPNGVRCPHCGGTKRIGKLNGASTRLGTYKCYGCRKSFSATYGTLFMSSHVPVHKWLQAIYLTGGGTKNIRPHHLQQILNVSFKTASFILRRISEAAASAEQTGSPPLTDTVATVIQTSGPMVKQPTPGLDRAPGSC